MEEIMKMQIYLMNTMNLDMVSMKYLVKQLSSSKENFVAMQTLNLREGNLTIKTEASQNIMWSCPNYFS
jgi:hypothetical protein